MQHSSIAFSNLTKNLPISETTFSVLFFSKLLYICKNPTNRPLNIRMKRNCSIKLLTVLRGSPPKRDKSRSYQVIHASQRPPYAADIDFNSLGLQFPLLRSPTVTSDGWSSPPDSPPTLPFIVERTHVTKALPVYTDYKGGRTKVITILRKCGGNVEALKSEMEKVCGREVRICPGSLKVDGNYVLRLKSWLTGVGF